MGIWADAGGPDHILPYSGAAYRVVESQEQAATMQLVDTLQEQELLEQLLDGSKPRPAGDAEHLPYLLKTPFRYPPLRHGSRFGRRTQRGIFYASLGLRSALAETAYYRLVFLAGMTEPPQQPIQSPMSSFRTRIKTAHAVRLDRPPFEGYRERISCKTRYQDSQNLGTDMRAAGVQAAIYYAARETRPGCRNIAVFAPAALTGTVSNNRSWHCSATPSRVIFVAGHDGEGHEFERTLFEVDGVLPTPAV